MKAIQNDFLRVKSTFNPAKYRKIAPLDTTVLSTLSVLNTNPCKISCIYLFKTSLFKSTLREDESVYKYGYTNDLMRRLLEHEKKYGSDITLQIHSNIPEYYLRNAENDVRDYFVQSNVCVPDPNMYELVRLTKDQVSVATNIYKLISEKYNSSYQVLTTENNLMKKILKIDEKIY